MATFDIIDAIQSETSLKRWPRQWTVELIEKTNPEWFVLFLGIWLANIRRSGVTAWILGSARVASLLAPP
nr:hypothetical protein [Mesorhizobium sp.]